MIEQIYSWDDVFVDVAVGDLKVPNVAALTPVPSFVFNQLWQKKEKQTKKKSKTTGQLQVRP